MIVLGIDPGFTCTGFGIIKKEGNRAILLDYGYIPLPAKESLVIRIGIFNDFFQDKITRWSVTDIALETPFLGKNIQSFLKLGYLRGNLYLLAYKNNLILHEFSPREVKLSITGSGAAAKDQVARVILRLFPKMEPPKKEDVTDAIAVTLCGLWHIKITEKTIPHYK